MNKISKVRSADACNNTSFHGDTILASCNDIRSKLGVDVACYWGDKTHFEFELELEDGTPFSIYDWKEGDWITEDSKLYYHIGARTIGDSRKVLNALADAGLKAFRGGFAIR